MVLESLVSNAKDVLGRITHPHRRMRSPAVYMYHAVSDNEIDWGPWQYAVSPETFTRQISSFVENNRVINLEEVVAYINDGVDLDGQSVALTFDDGFANIVENALPILDEYNVPATVFVSTSFVSTQQAPYEYRLAEGIQSHNHLYIELKGKQFEFDLSNEHQKATAYQKLHNQVKFAEKGTREQLLNELGNPSANDIKPLTRSNILTLHKNPIITVASHGHLHRPLNCLDISDVEKDLEKSRNFLADITDKLPDHFSYPYGVENHQIQRTVKKAGFKSAVSTEARRIRPRDWGKPYRIPRIDGSK